MTVIYYWKQRAKSNKPLTWVWRNWGLTEKLSASAHIQALALGWTVCLKSYSLLNNFVSLQHHGLGGHRA